MPKGQDQVVEAAGLCRRAAEKLKASADNVDPSACTRLESLAGRLEAMRDRFFVKMAPALRYTSACLSAASEIEAAIGREGAPSDLDERLTALDGAVKALEGKANAPGSVTIT